MNSDSLSKEQIKEIAEQLDVGFRCFWSREDGSLRFIPDTLKFPEMNLEFFEEDMDYIDENMGGFDALEPMGSRDSFKIMEEFADSLSESNRLKGKLYRALNKKNPFREFKWEVDNSGEYRNQWFQFRDESLFNWVKKLVDEIIEFRKWRNDEEEKESKLS